MITTQRTVLAAAIFKRDHLETLIANENVFTDPECKRIYEALSSMYNDNIHIELPGIVAYCEQIGKPVNAVVIAELAQMPITFNFQFLYEQLLKQARARKVKDLAKDLYHCKDEMEFDKFIEALTLVQSGAIADDRVYTPDRLTSGELDEIFDDSYFTRTGIQALDEKLIGMFDGQVIVIAGRPGKGKTTLAMQILKNVNYPTLFLSGEMSAKQELYAKLLSNMAEVETWRIEAKRYENGQRERVLKAHEYYKENLRITVYDGQFSWAKIKNIIRKYGDRRVIVIDYLQIISGASGGNEHLRIAEISRGVKNLARELRRPIILLSQLSRDVEKQNREPTLSDLRESGAIEADADVVIFLNEKDGWYPIIAKNRKGKVGSIKGVDFVKEFCRIADSSEVKEEWWQK